MSSLFYLLKNSPSEASREFLVSFTFVLLNKRKMMKFWGNSVCNIAKVLYVLFKLLVWSVTCKKKVGMPSHPENWNLEKKTVSEHACLITMLRKRCQTLNITILEDDNCGEAFRTWVCSSLLRQRILASGRLLITVFHWNSGDWLSAVERKRHFWGTEML